MQEYLQVMIQQNELQIDFWYRHLETGDKVQVTSFGDDQVNFTPENQGNSEIQYYRTVEEFCQSYEPVNR